MKRKITPHKGGRTERLLICLTPADKEELRSKAARAKCSMADFLIQAVKEFPTSSYRG